MTRFFNFIGKVVNKAYARFTGSGSYSSGAGVPAFTWVPLITSDAFTGINTDVLTTSVGIISIMVVVVGIGILIKVFTH